MARLLLRRKSSIKTSIKPTPIVKQPIPVPGVEFRWSTTAVQEDLPETISLMNFHLIELDNSQQKAFFSSPLSAARNSTESGSSFSVEKNSPRSPRLPNINDVNKKKELFTSTDEHNNRQTSPVSLSYAELHHAQHPIQTKKMSRTRYSIYPLINEKSKTQNDKYIRLETSQLRRLNVSKKYMKEAKTLYFNAASKVFVPRHSIVQIS